MRTRITAASAGIAALALAAAPGAVAATDGSTVDLAERCASSSLVVVFAYPRTGRPGTDSPAGSTRTPSRVARCRPSSRPRPRSSRRSRTRRCRGR